MFLLFSENCFSSLNLVFSIFYLLVVNGFLKKNLVLHRKKIKKKRVESPISVKINGFPPTHEYHETNLVFLKLIFLLVFFYLKSKTAL